MPTISIIVPVYNVEDYIHRCVDSILSQTWENYELILVNDGSPDTCGEICNEYAKVDRRVKVIHKLNGGLSDARNVGLDNAIGEYIGFVDSDDYIENDMYEKLLSACLENNVVLSMCGRYDVYDHEIKPAFALEGCKVWNSKESIESLLTWDNIDSSVCDKLFRKELFSSVRFPVGRYNEDIFVMTQILFRAGQIAHIGESKYYYCHRSDSITTEAFSPKKMDLLDASQTVLEFVLEKYPELEQKAKSFHYKGIIHLLSMLNKPNSEIDLYRSEHDRLRELLWSNLPAILSNRHIDLRRKVVALLLLTNSYSSIRRFAKFLERSI